MMGRYESIVQELEAARSIADEMFREFQEATGQAKSRLFYLWNSATSTVARLQVEYELILNPPVLLPDLAPRGVARSRSGPTSFDAAVVIANQGPAPAVGPFRVTLGVEYPDYSQDPPLRVYREAALNVPGTVTIEPGANYQTTDAMRNIVISRRPGSDMPSVYEYFLMVDTDNQIAEINKQNNYLSFSDHRSPPE